MLVVRVGGCHGFVTVLAAVGSHVGQVLVLHVVLQGGEARAGLDEAALRALVGPRPQLRDPRPDHVRHQLLVVCTVNNHPVRIIFSSSNWHSASPFFLHPCA